jgi:hypothetical protein
MLRLGRLVAYILPFLTACLAAPPDLQARWYFPASIDLLSVTIKDLQLLLSNGTITSVQLTQRYLVSQDKYRVDFRTT